MRTARARSCPDRSGPLRPPAGSKRGRLHRSAVASMGAFRPESPTQKRNSYEEPGQLTRPESRGRALIGGESPL